MQGAWIEDLTRPEVGGRLAASVVVISVGAIAKEHGPHLPLKTDWLLARKPGCRTAEALPVLIAQGARHIAIVNTGVSTEPVLRTLTRELYETTGPRIPVADITRIFGCRLIVTPACIAWCDHRADAKAALGDLRRHRPAGCACVVFEAA